MSDACKIEIADVTFGKASFEETNALVKLYPHYKKIIRAEKELDTLNRLNRRKDDRRRKCCGFDYPSVIETKEANLEAAEKEY